MSKLQQELRKGITSLLVGERSGQRDGKARLCTDEY